MADSLGTVVEVAQYLRDEYGYAPAFEQNGSDHIAHWAAGDDVLTVATRWRYGAVTGYYWAVHEAASSPPLVWDGQITGLYAAGELVDRVHSFMAVRS